MVGPLPVLFLVDADAEARERIATALTRRFGADYQVHTAGTESEGLAMLEQLGNDGVPVALVAADLALTGDEGGITFLERAHVIHPGASRVLLVAMDRHGTRIPFDSLAALRRASALNRIDFWVVKGGFSPEEWLYLRVQEALSTWTRFHGPHHEVLRIVGDQWSPRSHAASRDDGSQHHPPWLLSVGLRARTRADRRTSRRRCAVTGGDPPRRDARGRHVQSSRRTPSSAPTPPSRTARSALARASYEPTASSR